MSSNEHGSTRVILAALAGNVAIAASKFVAAYFSTSTAMLAEAVHSLSDTGNEILLLIGMSLAARPPTERYPFGRAAEQYFWPFVVSLLLFSVGGAFAIYEGIEKLGHPSAHPTTHQLLWAYIVLGLSIVFELYSFSVAFGEFRRRKGSRTFAQVLVEGRDVTVLLVLMEDSAALAGLSVALVGVGMSQLVNARWPDAVASMLIGTILAAVAFVLARQTHSLLIGRSATREDRARARTIIEASPRVLRLVELLTLHIGPEDILLAIKVAFDPSLSIPELENAINEIERRLRREMPSLKRIFVEPDSHDDADPIGRPPTPAPPESAAKERKASG